MKSNRIGIAIGSLTAGSVTLTWKDPDTVDGSSPTQIELEYAPKVFFVTRTGASASAGHLRVAVTATGCTVTSDDNSDDGDVRVVGICRAADLLGV